MQRVHCKVAILTYKTIHTKELDYLFDLNRFYEPVRTLRSSSCGLLSRNRARTVIASRAFKHSSVLFITASLLTFVTVIVCMLLGAS